MRKNYLGCNFISRFVAVLAFLAIGLSVHASEVALTLSGGNGTAANPYLISNAADIQELAAACNMYPIKVGEVTVGHYAGKYFKITNDIDMASVTDYHPIAAIIGLAEDDSITQATDYYFAGTLDGGDHVISNLCFIDSLSYAGLFGLVNGASISNLKFAASDTIRAYGYQGAVAGYAINSTFSGITSDAYLFAAAKYLGGVVGISDGCTYQNCHAGKAAYLYGRSSYVGGIVGHVINGVNISDCTSAAYIYGMSGMRAGGIVSCIETSSKPSVITRCKALAGLQLTGPSRCGGIVGYAMGYSADDLTNITITDCEAEAGVTITSNTHTGCGGIVGMLANGTVTGCNSAATVSCWGWGSAGIVGYVVDPKAASGTAEGGAARISNCHNSGYITTTTEVTTSYGCGGIVGYAEAGIDATHAVIISDCSNDGHIESWHTVGGIAGRLYKYHTVKNCINHGDIVATREYDLDAEKQYFTTSSAAGGIVGQTQQNCVVETCVNTGNVTAQAADCGGIVGCVLGPLTMKDVYNNGHMTGFMYVGGIVGDVYSGSYYGGKPTLANAYTTGTVTATREATTYYSNVCGYSQNAWTSITNTFFPDTLAVGKYDKTTQQATMTAFMGQTMAETLGQAYVWNEAALPMISLFSTDAEAQLWAAYYQMADGDSATHITKAVTLPQLSELKWTATGAMTVQNGKAVPAAKGDATVTVTNGTNSRSFTFVCDPATVVKGDVNGDGIVDVSDVTELINVILGSVVLDDPSRADVDGNGVTDVSDVTSLIKIILGA